MKKTNLEGNNMEETNLGGNNMENEQITITLTASRKTWLTLIDIIWVGQDFPDGTAYYELYGDIEAALIGEHEVVNPRGNE